MMAAYTVAVREKGKRGPFRFLEYDGDNVRLHDTASRSKPLTRQEATIAALLLKDGAEQAGRPIEARVVRLVV